MRDFLLIFGAAALFGLAGFGFIEWTWASLDRKCQAVHGHLYRDGRTALCLTPDNRVIEGWR